MTTLDKVQKGKTVEVVNVTGLGTPLRRRLLDLGLTPKTKLTFVRSAPLGDPIEIKVRGYELTIRRDDAKLVEVK